MLALLQFAPAPPETWYAMPVAHRTMLALLKGDQSVHVVPVEDRPVHIGRAPENDLAVVDRTVSRHHATVWNQGGKTYVRDHGTTNGSFLNEMRVDGAVEIPGGSKVRLGLNTWLQLQQVAISEPVLHTDLLLLDLTAGIQHQLLPGDNPLPEGPGSLAIRPDKVVLLTPLGEEVVGLGQPFEHAGRRYELVRPVPEPAPTGEMPELTSNAFAYKVNVRLSGPSGPEATFTRMSSGEHHRVTAPNRVVLLCVLARQLKKDLEAGVEPSRSGWARDHDIRRGIWGRQADTQDANTLHVVLHRLRRELKKGGFDPACIEKGRGSSRLLVFEIDTD